MVAIKGMIMPKGCWYSTDLKMSGVTTCPLKTYCSEKHIKEAPLDTRPSDCPLVETKAEDKLEKIEQILNKPILGELARIKAIKKVREVLGK